LTTICNSEGQQLGTDSRLLQFEDGFTTPKLILKYDHHVAMLVGHKALSSNPDTAKKERDRHTEREMIRSSKG
jgi:hypothetical protein